MNTQAVALSLAETGHIFYDPDQQQRVTAETYLSGNIYEKLDQASNAQDLPDWIQSTLEQNIAALENVRPLPLLPAATAQIKVACLHDMGLDLNDDQLTQALDNVICASLGQNWIPTSTIKEFALWLLETNQGISVEYTSEKNEWKVSGYGSAMFSAHMTSTYGTERRNALELLEDALRSRTPVIYDYDSITDTRVINETEAQAAFDKLKILKEKFKEWIWTDEARSVQLCRIYNQRFGGIRPRHFNGEHLTLPGLNPEITPRPHQKNSTWRILQSRAVGLYHCVGAGKTLVYGMAAMELRRLHLASKPCLVVLNETLAQIGKEIRHYYPSARILVADKESFTANKRKEFIAKMVMGDWDLVILSHSQFFRIPLSQEAIEWFLQEERCKLQEGSGGRATKGLEIRKINLAGRVNEASKNRKDATIFWDQLGIDAIFFDESQALKNLHYDTRQRNIAGMPNTHSQQAQDSHIKLRWTLETGGRVILGTGSMISNCVAELFTQQRYLDHDYLQSVGLEHFDCWSSLFGEIITQPEITATGTFKTKSRFSRFQNLPELITMISRFADIQTPEMLKLPRPDAEYISVSAPPCPDLEDYMDHLVERAERVANKRVDRTEDNNLNICTDGRKAALDVRLVAAGSPTSTSKVHQLCHNVWTIWNLTRARKGTQLIFCDLSTPTTKGPFNIYAYIREVLCGLGIPREQIAFTHECKNDKDRSRLFQSVNKGQVRVLLGSTQKLGTGVNVQERLIAVHSLDAPWRPSDLEQREGRILRQGNTWKRIMIFRYVTEGRNGRAGFDAFSWQTLQVKQEFISQLMNSSIKMRSVEETDTTVLSYAQIKSLATGDPLLSEKASLDQQLATLQRQYRAWEAERARSFFELSRLRTMKEKLPELIQRLEQQWEKAQNHRFELWIGTEVAYSEAAADALLRKVRQRMGKHIDECIGRFNTLPVVVRSSWGKPSLHLADHYPFKTNIVSLLDAFHQIPRDIENKRQQLESAIRNIPLLEARSRENWELEADLTRVTQRLEEIDQIMEDSLTEIATDEDAPALVEPFIEVDEELPANTRVPAHILEDLRSWPDPDWVTIITDQVEDNVIQLPVQRAPQKLEVVYTFEETGSGFAQGCLF